jgi:RNA polymerase primary sigma factor
VGELVSKVHRIDKTLLEIPPSQRIASIAQNLGISERRVMGVKKAIFTMTSIDSDEEADIELLESYDFPIDGDREDPIPNWMLRRSFETLFKKLDPKDLGVIKKRFGWYDGYSMTLEEVGELYGVTRERIRQIEAKALRRLSTPVSLRHLGALSKKSN